MTPEYVREIVEANMKRCDWARSVGGIASQDVFENKLDTTGYRFDHSTDYWIPEIVYERDNVERLDDWRA